MSTTKRNNNVMVSLKHSRYVFADVTKHLLHEGEKEVELSALGNAINEAVAVAELLKGQGLCAVTKISTARLSEADLQAGDDKDKRGGRRNTDRISITVVKTDKFEEVYQQQQKEREAKAAEKGEEKK